MGTAFLSGQSSAGFPAGWKEEVSAKVEVGAIAKNDAVLNYTKSFEEVFTKLSNPSTLPGGQGRCCAFDPTGIYLAICSSTAPYIFIYKRSGDTFTKLANPDVLPGSYTSYCTFSKDGSYLVVGLSITPFVYIYKRSGDTFAKLTNPDVLPSNEVLGADFSNDGNYLAVAHSGITLYKRVGDVFTKLTGNVPYGTAYGVKYSPDDVHLAVSIPGSSPYINMFKRSGEIYSLLSITWQTFYGYYGSGDQIAFSPDGKLFTIFGGGYAPDYTYRRIGDTFALITPFATESSGVVKMGVFSKDGGFLAVGGDTSPRLKMYRRHGEKFEKLTNLTNLPAASVYAMSFDPTGVYLAIVYDGSPYISIFKTTITKYVQPLPLPGTLSFANQKVGLAKETGAVGASIKTNVFSKLDNFI